MARASASPSPAAARTPIRSAASGAAADRPVPPTASSTWPRRRTARSLRTGLLVRLPEQEGHAVTWRSFARARLLSAAALLGTQAGGWWPGALGPASVVVPAAEVVAL